MDIPDLEALIARCETAIREKRAEQSIIQHRIDVKVPELLRDLKGMVETLGNEIAVLHVEVGRAKAELLQARGLEHGKDGS